MATVSVPLSPGSAAMVGTAFPQFVQNGTNHPIDGLAFDASTQETCKWGGLRAPGYVSGGTVRVSYYSSATTGAAVFAAGLNAVTPTTDNTDVEALALPTFTQVTGATFAATAKRLYESTITLSAGSLNSIAAGDVFELVFRRVSGDGADTASVDVIVTSVVLEYLDA